MHRWTVDGITYRAAPIREWANGSASYKAANWSEDEHNRDRRGRFSRKPGLRAAAPPATPKRPDGPHPAATVKPALYSEDRQDIDLAP